MALSYFKTDYACLSIYILVYKATIGKQVNEQTKKRYKILKKTKLMQKQEDENLKNKEEIGQIKTNSQMVDLN